MRLLRLFAVLTMFPAAICLGPRMQAQSPVHQVYVTAPDGVRISVQEVGIPSGRALVLVHGLLGSHLSWKKQLSDPRLLKYRVITYDLRGHGMSGAPSDPDAYANGKLWADDLRAVIEAKHLDHPVLVGWSLGGLVVSDYLRLYGDSKLGGLVYVDGVIENSAEYLFPKPGIVQLLTSEDLADHLEGSRQFVALCFYKQPDRALFETLFSAATMASPLLTRTLFTSGVLLAHPVAFPAIHVPTLLMYGKHDAHLRIEMVKREKQLIPGAKVSVYPDAGHSPFIESPERLNTELDGFISGVPTHPQ